MSSSAGSLGGEFEHFEQDAHADQSAVELDIEARQALGRLIGQEERGDEGEELARRRPGRDDAIAAIGDGHGDGDAAERFHQRRGAAGNARQLVGLVLDRRDVAVEAFAHGVFQRERLDDADALQRLLQRLDDTGAAHELAVRDPFDAADQLAQHQQSRRRHHEGEKRHQRVFDDHDGDQPDQRQQVAAERGDQEVDDLRRRRRAGGEARDEFGRVPVGEKADALVEQLGEHAPLIVGDDAVADLRQQHAVAVGREAFGGEQGDGDAAEDEDAGEALVDVGLVDDVADQVGAERRAAGRDRHQREAERVFAPMHKALLGQQSPDQGDSAVTLVVGRWQSVVVHPPSIGV